LSITIEVVFNGSSIEVDATIEDFKSTPQIPLYIDPDTNICEIYDAAGTLVTSAIGTIVRDGLGLYHVDMPITSTGYVTGKWRAKWIATKSSLPSIGEASFAVAP
jgi:hypothetical protein